MEEDYQIRDFDPILQIENASLEQIYDTCNWIFTWAKSSFSDHDDEVTLNMKAIDLETAEEYISQASQIFTLASQKCSDPGSLLDGSYQQAREELLNLYAQLVDWALACELHYIAPPTVAQLHQRIEEQCEDYQDAISSWKTLNKVQTALAENFRLISQNISEQAGGLVLHHCALGKKDFDQVEAELKGLQLDLQQAFDQLQIDINASRTVKLKSFQARIVFNTPDADNLEQIVCFDQLEIACYASDLVFELESYVYENISVYDLIQDKSQEIQVDIVRVEILLPPEISQEES